MSTYKVDLRLSLQIFPSYTFGRIEFPSLQVVPYCTVAAGLLVHEKPDQGANRDRVHQTLGKTMANSSPWWKQGKGSAVKWKNLSLE